MRVVVSMSGAIEIFDVTTVHNYKYKSICREVSPELAPIPNAASKSCAKNSRNQDQQQPGATTAMDPALALEASALSRRRAIDEAAQRGDSQIQQFYAGATVLVTGGAGFLGKQLVEKLLRSCDVRKVYMLLRPTKIKTVQERLAHVLKNPVFDSLHANQPSFVDKIVPVEGDVSKLRVGISEADWSMLTEEVEIIFHGAASIHFSESITSAALTNVRGTREMLHLGKACKKLRSYVHISTAYSHATSGRIGQQVLEQFYPSPIPPDALLQLVEHVNDARMDAITPLLIGDWPNTYTFTKAVAEELVRSIAGELPVCVVRPAIVICARSEPAPGWLDKSSVFGPSGIIFGIGLGALHVLPVRDDVPLDLVPLDLVNNAVLAAGWQTARGAPGPPEIYTISGVRNAKQFTTGLVGRVLNGEGRNIASDKALWYNYGFSTTNKLLYLLSTWLLHYFPALLADGVLLLTGQAPRATRLYKKMHSMFAVFSYFLNNSWQFNDSNLLSLYETLSPTDRVLFNCDVASVNSKDQTLIWGIGVRKYIFRDGLNKTALGVRKQFWFKIANYILLGFMFYSLWKIFNYAVWILTYLLSLLKMVKF